MNVLNTQCPTDAVLSDFGLGKLDASSTDTVARHLEMCADCQRRVAGVTGDSFIGRLRQAGGPAQPTSKRERTFVPGDSLANAANSTDGIRENGLPRPSRSVTDDKLGNGLGSPSSVSAPAELANHPDYELIKELGQGGMGTVYLAKNRMMDRLEVLKVISKELLARQGALERFQQEIRSAAKLAHPNIVAAYSVQRPGDLLVLAMEYVKGQDLSQVVKGRGCLPVANAAFYIHQVALGLQHAHEKGMVHRDIKPNNLMLAIEGKKHVVKILDFGLAKATSEKGAQTGLTKSGQMLGTPDYVAPEQTLDAHKADIRADIYSLGCTLYFLLSGGPPFQEQSLYAILEAHHKRDAKSLNLLRPDVPAELAAIVAKMMAKDPAMRYQTPGEVAKALVPFFKPGQATARAETHSDQRSSELTQSAIGDMAPVVVAAAPRAMRIPVPPAPAADDDGVRSISIVTVKRRKTEILIVAGAVLAGLLITAAIVVKRKAANGTLVVEVNGAEQDGVVPDVASSPEPITKPRDDSDAGAANVPPPVVEQPTTESPSEDDVPDEMPLEPAPVEKMPEATEPEDKAAAEIHDDGPANVPGPAETGDSPATAPSADGAAATKPPGEVRIARKRNQPPSGIAFKANTKWANPTWSMTVTWRSGVNFKATYMFRGNVLAAVGTINGDRISWRGKDVRIVKGRVGADDHEGTLVATKEGYRIHFISRNKRGQTFNWTVDRK